MIMTNWFECKIRTEKTLEGGAVKKVTEPYLVNAINFTEAEARIIEEITPFCNGQLEVADIKRVRYCEMFPCDAEHADKWYKVKCNFITLDEKTQTEKKVSQLMLVQAGDLREAVKLFDEGMKGSMMDYDIAAVTETAILDVFPYGKQEEDAKPEYEQ